jgi:hypothetical protein
MEITARRWRAGSFKLQISGMGRVVTRKSVKMLITLAEKTMAPSFMQWYGSVGLISQYARIGLDETLARS